MDTRLGLRSLNAAELSRGQPLTLPCVHRQWGVALFNAIDHPHTPARQDTARSPRDRSPGERSSRMGWERRVFGVPQRADATSLTSVTPNPPILLASALPARYSEYSQEKCAKSPPAAGFSIGNKPAPCSLIRPRPKSRSLTSSPVIPLVHRNVPETLHQQGGRLPRTSRPLRAPRPLW